MEAALLKIALAWLAVATAVAIGIAALLRGRWSRLPIRSRRILIGVSGAGVIVYVLELTAHWHTASVALVVSAILCKRVAGSSAFGFTISYHPRHLPFMEREVNWIRFDDQKCDSREAFLLMQPDRKHVLARCPWYDFQHKDGYHDFLVPLY